MKEWCVVILLSILASITGLPANLNAAEWDTTLEFSNAYRLDNLDWNIAGDAGSNPA